MQGKLGILGQKMRALQGQKKQPLVLVAGPCCYYRRRLGLYLRGILLFDGTSNVKGRYAGSARIDEQDQGP